MPTFSITSVHAEFVQAHQRTATLLASARDFRRPNGATIHVRDVEEIAALALLKLTLAWESFVEDSFLRYMCGAKSNAGIAPILLIPRQPSLQAAFNTLAGGSSYLGWHPDSIIRRANSKFDAGAPYATAVAGAKSVLIEMAEVRNRLAHRSDHSVAAFQTVVRNHLGFVPRGMTPGRFLLTSLPAMGGITTFDHYSAQLTATAFLVANHV